MASRTEQQEIERVSGWQQELAALHSRIAPRFARPEVRERAGRFLRGLLGPVERRNGWQLAEAMGERTPDGVQRLLNGSRWDAGEVRDDLRSYVVEHLGHPEAVLVIDETGFLKKGEKSVGVARQYSGTAGKVENCQVGVFLAYAAPRGRAFIDRALYLPEEEWATDGQRRAAARVPAEIGFATKGELAQRMLSGAFEAGVPAKWIIADEVYGNGGKLRRWLEARKKPYVLAVARSHPLMVAFRSKRAEEVVAEAPPEAWARVQIGAGSKGPRVYDWARARLPYENAPGWARWLLVRRSVSQPQELAYYRAYGPEEATVEELAKVAGSRWSIEEGFERAKGEVGLDDYEVRYFDSWHRHITLCLLAHAFLEVSRAAANDRMGNGASTPGKKGS
ncbi:MAG TPA: IS701 family transposase [Rubrobacter sp.]|nr:IS701 family transposase [Rubrobacter sp.]